MAKLAIVSAFGRGNWLAAKMSQLGVETSLVDVTGKLGRWAPEDWEGPFGLFLNEYVQPLQLERLEAEDYSDNSEIGFSLWLPQGPVDFQGPLSKELLERLEISAEVKEYLSRYDSLTPSQVENAKREFFDQEFSKTWLVHLAHQIACSVYVPNAYGQEFGRPLPLYSKHAVRRVSRKGLDRSLDWCESHGVKVYRKATLEDVSIEQKRLKGLEVSGDYPGLIATDQFVWMLTSEETFLFNEKVSRVLYPGGVLRSTWSWIRYRVQLSEKAPIDSIPVKTMIIKDLGLPWTHDNLVSMIKTVSSGNYDLWIRIPSHQRFQRKYLETQAEAILDLLAHRIPLAEPKILDMPQDYLYDYSELGPSRFPVFDSEELRKHAGLSLKNLKYENAETLKALDWQSQWTSQTKLADELVISLKNKNESLESEMHP